MDIFDEMEKYGHEELNFFYEPEFDLKAIIAIHNLSLGMAFGTTQSKNYFFEEDAIDDALKLSKNSTMCASILNCDLGGAASVLINDIDTVKSEGYLRTYGRFLKSISNRFCTMVDSSFSTKDMLFISKEFPNVIGQPEFYNKKDPAYFIAYGAICGLKSAVNEVFGNFILDKKTILVHGLTPSSIQLIKMLHVEGAKILVTDKCYDNIKQLRDEIKSIEIVKPNEYDKINVDIFMPCSISKVVTKNYVLSKKCKIIAGIAKLQLEDDSLDKLMFDEGIIYVPEIIMTASEAVIAFSEMFGYDDEHIKHHIEQISDIVSEILIKSKELNEPPTKIVETMALNRLEIVHKLKKIYVNN